MAQQWYSLAVRRPYYKAPYRFIDMPTIDDVLLKYCWEKDCRVEIPHVGLVPCRNCGLYHCLEHIEPHTHGCVVHYVRHPSLQDLKAARDFARAIDLCRNPHREVTRDEMILQLNMARYRASKLRIMEE